jgi:hypothetical protein
MAKLRKIVFGELSHGAPFSARHTDVIDARA